MGQTAILLQYQRWVTKLLGYNFDIEYKLGKYNKVADALSKKGPAVELTHLSTPVIVDIDTIEREVEEDESLQKIIIEIQIDSLSHPKYTIYQGRLLYKRKVSHLIFL